MYALTSSFQPPPLCHKTYKAVLSCFLETVWLVPLRNNSLDLRCPLIITSASCLRGTFPRDDITRFNNIADQNRRQITVFATARVQVYMGQAVI